MREYIVASACLVSVPLKQVFIQHMKNWKAETTCVRLCCYSYVPSYNANETCKFIQTFQAFKKVCDEEDITTIP